MRRVLPWIALAVGVAVALAVAVGGYLTADHAWSQIVDYESPYVETGLPPAAAGPALSARVVLVIVDGMRDEITHEMSTVQNLREHGSDITVVTPEPSLSYPTWTTLLSGAPHEVTGVTTNWYEGRVKVETLIDTALAARMPLVVVGPESFEALYGAERADGVYLEDWVEGEYLSGRLVEEAIRLVEEIDPSLVILHLPDLDEAGHDAGADSVHYAEIADRIDFDLAFLVSELEDGDTTFVVCADHGHVDAGGHGGWEHEVTHVSAVFAGGAAALSQETAAQEDVAPTVATLAGIPIPRDANGRVLGSVLGASVLDASEVAGPVRAQRAAAIASRIGVISGDMPSAVELAQQTYAETDALLDEAIAARLAEDRRSRLPLAAVLLAATLVVLLMIGIASWRALVAALAGVLAYHVVYNLAYFVMHGHAWSLSAFNDEDAIQAFFNLRMVETVVAALVAAAVAAVVYPMLRREPKGPRTDRSLLGGWLALGVAVVLAIQATMGWQIAWYVWWWGPNVTWRIPDLMWGFKFDLDLIQTTALGAAALLAPVVTYLVGRYHPRTRTGRDDGLQGSS